jgi:signal transduction histidine kinase
VGVDFVVEVGMVATEVAKTAVIHGNETQLGQAIGNLLDNAIKFTPEGGRVVVTVAEEETAVFLTICDSGIGIPADDMPQLFHRFHRGRNVAAYPGNGLGLAIARAIIVAHGGQLTAVSDGNGTVFTVRLPLI